MSGTPRPGSSCSRTWISFSSGRTRELAPRRAARPRAAAGPSASELPSKLENQVHGRTARLEVFGHADPPFVPRTGADEHAEVERQIVSIERRQLGIVVVRGVIEEVAEDRLAAENPEPYTHASRRQELVLAFGQYPGGGRDPEPQAPFPDQSRRERQVRGVEEPRRHH